MLKTGNLLIIINVLHLIVLEINQCLSVFYDAHIVTFYDDKCVN